MYRIVTVMDQNITSSNIAQDHVQKYVSLTTMCDTMSTVLRSPMYSHSFPFVIVELQFSLMIDPVTCLFLHYWFIRWFVNGSVLNFNIYRTT